MQQNLFGVAQCLLFEVAGYKYIPTNSIIIYFFGVALATPPIWRATPLQAWYHNCVCKVVNWGVSGWDTRDAVAETSKKIIIHAWNYNCAHKAFLHGRPKRQATKVMDLGLKILGQIFLWFNYKYIIWQLIVNIPST